MTVNSQPSIAGVVLCLNEENTIARALQSLQWCNELLVVDSGSHDSSKKIAEEYGAKIIEHCQHGQFLITEQRNWALVNGGLQSDWVIFLDADEEIRSECKDEILNAITNSKNINAYELTPRYWFLGKWLKRTQGYPNWHPRLLKRGKIFLEGGVWESFTASDKVNRIYAPYEHFAFSKGIDDWINRHQRYAQWEADRIYAVLKGGGISAFGTKRQRKLRLLAAYMWPARPILRFTQKYFFQCGFLEGWQGLLFASLIATYEIFIVTKLIELFRKERGLPL